MVANLDLIAVGKSERSLKDTFDSILKPLSREIAVVTGRTNSDQGHLRDQG